MDFVRSYFGINEPLTSWTLFSSLLDWFAMHTQQTSQKVRKKVCSTGQRLICTKVTSCKIHILLFSWNYTITYMVLPWSPSKSFLLMAPKRPEGLIHFFASKTWTLKMSDLDFFNIFSVHTPVFQKFWKDCFSKNWFW